MTTASDPPVIPDLALLCLRIGALDYALEIDKVREIRGWSKPTALPHAPAYLSGLVNLRGAVLPVIDLAARLGLPGGDTGARDVIVVVEAQDGGVGLHVSAVLDIVTFPCAALCPPPEAIRDGTARFLRGLVLQETGMLRLLDLDSVLGFTHCAEA